MSSLLQQQMTRYYEYMKPRYTNPTYSSFNVGTSLAMSASHPPSRQLQPRSNHKRMQTPVQVQGQKSGKAERQNESRRSRSQLSHYGTNSLNRFGKSLNEQDIFEKQQKKYNIISILPKEHNETIKKYPKFHLENLDQNYYKKLQLQGEYDHLHNSRTQNE